MEPTQPTKTPQQSPEPAVTNSPPEGSAAPLLHQAPPLPTQSSAQRTRFIIILIIISAPVIYLGWRLYSAWSNDPARVYQRQSAKIEAARESARLKYTSELDGIAAKLEQLVKNRQPLSEKGSPIIGSTYDSKTKQYQTLTAAGRINQINANATFESISGEGTLDACWNRVSYWQTNSGSKFDMTPNVKIMPIGHYFQCMYRVSRAYIWTGDEKTLSELVLQAAKEAGVNLGGSSTGIDQEGVRYSLLVAKNEGQQYTRLANHDLSLIEPYQVNWQKVFTSQNLRPLPLFRATKQFPEDNRLILVISANERYFSIEKGAI